MVCTLNFPEDMVLCAGSNKSVEVFDLNVGKPVRTIHDVHTRAPHVICQNEVSHCKVLEGIFVKHELLLLLSQCLILQPYGVLAGGGVLLPFIDISFFMMHRTVDTQSAV